MSNMSPRRFAPATARNRDPILGVLGPLLPESGLVLEVASGTGEHVVHFARARPELVWQPSDPSPEARESIAAWVAAEGLSNVRAPLALDAAAEDWPVAHVDAVVCINMLHISPWAATEGLMKGIGKRLPVGGLLYIYGPFCRADTPTAPSNEAFDADLKGRDARWGLRRLEDVRAEAEVNGLGFERFVEMPANNLSLIFRKR
jgi:SAM-dependent methyltransferase